jgi:transposase
MRKIHLPSEEEVQALEQGYKTGAKHHFRQRCKGILLSHKGYSVAQIAELLKHNKDTIYNWLNNYEAQGIAGLQNKSGQGVKALLDNLNAKEQKELEKAVAKSPQNLNQVGAWLSQKFDFEVTKYMLIRYLKKNSATPGEGFENG